MRAFFAIALLGCSACSDANRQTYAQAAVLTGAMIATVALHRAVAGGCWGHCSPGYLCNEESGLCERGECIPSCEYGWHCMRDARGEYLCVENPPVATIPPP